MDFLRDLYSPKKYTPAVIEFVDIAGLVKGASHGEGLGNKFLENIRRTDAIVHVVRCFDDENIIHVEGRHRPRQGTSTSSTSSSSWRDMELVERRIDKSKKAAKGGDKKFAHEAEVFEALLAHLNEGKSARSYDCGDDEREIIETVDLLSLKPVIYAANMDEEGIAGLDGNAYYQAVKAIADAEGAQVLPICARTEQELCELDDEDRAMFLESWASRRAALRG